MKICKDNDSQTRIWYLFGFRLKDGVDLGLWSDRFNRWEIVFFFAAVHFQFCFDETQLQLRPTLLLHNGCCNFTDAFLFCSFRFQLSVPMVHGMDLGLFSRTRPFTQQFTGSCIVCYCFFDMICIFVVNKYIVTIN